MGISLNPVEQNKRKKRYYIIIKNCSECPFWKECRVGGINDDFHFPSGCLLRDAGDEQEKSMNYRSVGGYK